MTESMWNKISRVLKRFFFWTFSQYAFILTCKLVIFLVACLIYGSAREAALASAHGPYTFESGLLLFIPITTFAYSLWAEFMQSGKAHWILIFPVLVVLALTISAIAAGLDWDITIMSIDGYMLGCLTSLIFVPAFQSVALVIHKRLKQQGRK